MTSIAKKIKRIFSTLNVNIILVGIGLVAFIFAGTFFVWWNKEIVINGGEGEVIVDNKLSSIAGLPCENYMQRPISVMMPSDPEPRPLSGISQADMVFEMPVTPGGVTRFMAVFQCEKPAEIGSIRSARKDFVPLAASLKSIYAHWGGEHGILAELNKHVIDNLNALVYDGSAFFRKSTAKAPHNGFTTYEKMLGLAEKLKYDLVDNFSGYLHQTSKPNRNLNNIVYSIDIDYPSPYNIRWVYVSNENVYKRTRGGRPETDKNSGQQVAVGVVIVMNTTASFLYDQYIDVNVTGSGPVKIYQDGMMIVGNWKKDPATLDSKLFFLDDQGKEIELAPGKIWVEVTTD